MASLREDMERFGLHPDDAARVVSDMEGLVEGRRLSAMEKKAGYVDGQSMDMDKILSELADGKEVIVSASVANKIPAKVVKFGIYIRSHDAGLHKDLQRVAFASKKPDSIEKLRASLGEALGERAMMPGTPSLGTEFDASAAAEWIGQGLNRNTALRQYDAVDVSNRRIDIIDKRTKPPRQPLAYFGVSRHGLTMAQSPPPGTGKLGSELAKLAKEYESMILAGRKQMRGEAIEEALSVSGLLKVAWDMNAALQSIARATGNIGKLLRWDAFKNSKRYAENQDFAALRKAVLDVLPNLKMAAYNITSSFEYLEKGAQSLPTTEAEEVEAPERAPLEEAGGKAFADYMAATQEAFLRDAAKEIKRIAGGYAERIDVKRSRSAVWLEYQGQDRSDMDLEWTCNVVVRDPDIIVFYDTKSAMAGTHHDQINSKIGIVTPTTISDLFRNAFGR